MHRRLTIAVSTALVAGLLALTGGAPGASAAGGLSGSLAADQCAKERKSLGKRAFRKKYGRKGTAACVEKRGAAARSAISVASEECQAQLVEWGPEFYDGWDSLEQCIAEVAALSLDAAASASFPTTRKKRKARRSRGTFDCPTAGKSVLRAGDRFSRVGRARRTDRCAAPAHGTRRFQRDTA